MARRMLTFVHNSFPCVPPLWRLSRRDVWFGLLSINLDAIDTCEGSGPFRPLVDFCSLQHRGLFAFSMSTVSSGLHLQHMYSASD